jgi:methionyl-tRNA formyltransferase
LPVAVNSLRALVAAGHKVVHVYTQPDRPAGRGKKLTPTPIAALAGELSLSLTRTADINLEPLPPADLLVVIAFGQKIAEPVIHHCRLGSVNLHSSLLPKYRGAAPINWAVINGDSITGNSIIRLASKMDAGAVLAQNRLTIGESETAGELHDRLAIAGAALMLNLIDGLQAGTASEIQQDHSLATLAPKLSRQTAQLDWSKPAGTLVRQINGLSPWPGCRVILTQSGKEIARLALVRSRPGSGSGSGSTAPGTIQADGTIAAGDGNSVEILELQPEGKRPMRLADFKNGRPWSTGMQIKAEFPAL